MTYSLIDKEDVTAKKLVSLLKSAYIDAELLEENIVLLKMARFNLFLLIGIDRIIMRNYTHMYIVNHAQQQILTKVMQLNQEYIHKCVSCFENDEHGLRFELKTSCSYRFSKGLNFHQLIDDIHFFASFVNDVRLELVDFITENRFDAEEQP